VYELYGIMLHKGGAFGGHYSAYIKDLEINNLDENIYEDKWYHFNDSFVSKISIT
jgi:ubiquitin C-terminal hydrolase